MCPDGLAFEPIANGSVWEIKVESDGGLYRRIVWCPSGFELIRDEVMPELDDCRQCHKDTYLLDPIRWQGQNVSATNCFPCEMGANCAGGNSIEATPSHWKMTFVYSDGHEYLQEAACGNKEEGTVCMFPEGSFLVGGNWGDPMRCTKLSDDLGLVCARKFNPSQRRNNITVTMQTNSKARILRCPPGSCDKNNMCLQNRTGPICGYCKPGFAMTTDGCSAEPCPDEKTLFPLRVASTVIFILAVLFLYLFLCWRPVFVQIDWFFAQIMSGIMFILSYFVCMGNSHGDGSEAVGSLVTCCETLMRWARWTAVKVTKIFEALAENHIMEISKILVSFVQVLGSFLDLSVKWPAVFARILQWAHGFTKIDILSLPGLACLWHGVRFWDKLLLYTVSPLALCAAFVLPAVVARITGLKETAPHRWRATMDRCWGNTSFLLFFIYPAICLGSMLVFNCDSQIGLLKIDYREVCPSFSNFAVWYSLFFFFLYPIGVPCFIMYALKYHGITQVVKEKVDAAQFTAMLSHFMKATCSTELMLFSRLVGFADHDEAEFDRQCTAQYQRLLRVQGVFLDSPKCVG